MKEIPVREAVGMVLCHDMTEIIPGQRKGARFRKGHIVTQEDIPALLDIGKEHIFVWDLEEGYVHEDDAARRMAAAAVGQNITLTQPKEGKIDLKAACEGVVKLNLDALFAVNALDNVCFATIHRNKVAKQGKHLGGMRVIPLVVKEELLQQFEAICRESGPIIEIVPMKQAKIGIVTTGSEVLNGRIQDGFGPVLRKKAEELHCSVMGQVFSGDDPAVITQAILDFIDQGADLVEVSGGMSVDPDDRTPLAIRNCGGEIVTYGTPVLPGAMFMLSYVKGVPVVGLPGCVMFNGRTVYDLVIPRILTGEKLTRMDFVRLAHGGQCQNCPVCHWPDCGFGE
jgi:hypothetical protein